MSTPPGMTQRATGRAGKSHDDVAAMDGLEPMVTGSPPGTPKRKVPREAAAPDVGIPGGGWSGHGGEGVDAQGVAGGGQEGAPQPRAEGGRERPADGEPTADELAVAFFATTQALKHTGRLCVEAAEPELRAISMPRARLLMVMDGARSGRGRVRMGDLAEALGVTARNVTTIVDGLEREGLIARKPDATDRRAILLELTERGKEHIAQVHALHRAIAERFFAPLDAGERCALLRLLEKVRDGQGEV